MVDKYEIETIHRVYDNTEGVCLEVKRHPDAIDDSWFIIRTPDDESKLWFGDIKISLTREAMRLLAKAIIPTIGEYK